MPDHPPPGRSRPQLSIQEQSLHRNDALDAKLFELQKRFSVETDIRGIVVTEAGSYVRLIDSCITQLKAQDLLGPVTRAKKKKKPGHDRQQRVPDHPPTGRSRTLIHIPPFLGSRVDGPWVGLQVGG